MIGETVKGYKIVEPLGSGSYGEVWAAEQPLIQTRVAIKLLRVGASTDRAYIRRFFNEARAVSRIKHAGIVKIFDVGFHDKRAFLIMELLEGESLDARIARKKRLPVGEVVEIGRQIASILEATHAAGIVHRDLKPENVFLVPDHELVSRERVKILDFGLAKLGQKITKSREILGTPAYMAPEQWGQAWSVDGRADVYSLGCIVFQMSCGRLPFEAEEFSDWYAKHREERPPRVRSLAPGIPDELDELIARMLAKSPVDRPAGHELVATFARIAGLPPPPPLPRQRSRWWSVAGAGAGMAAAAAAAATVWVTTHRPEPSANRWVRIDPPATWYLLGVSDTAPSTHAGFRASRDIKTPPEPYEIQEHEVTWSELARWFAVGGEWVVPPPWVALAASPAQLPVANITWSKARAYCRSLGGDLPTEEQWEYAARGSRRRPNPWGGEPLDRPRTWAFAGPDATPRPVMTSPQDRTPEPGRSIWDLAGNVQEWTSDVWRGDIDGQDEENVQLGSSSSRALRGLPLTASLSDVPPPVGAAFRSRLCATGPCVEKTREILASVGFRCVRPIER